MLGKVRLILWALVAIAAAGTLFLLLRSPAPPSESSDLSVASIGGPFTLTGTDGKPFASSRLNGKPAAIFFGFTHCPDVCPTTIARLAKLRRQVGDESFSIVFISVDPDRDRPADLARYVGLFGTPVVALTGSPAQIDRVKDQYGVFSQKMTQPDGDYNVQHTAAVFVIDRNGKFVSTIAPEEPDSAALDKLRRVVGA